MDPVEFVRTLPHVQFPRGRAELEKKFMVYGLLWGDHTVIVGHGSKGRAQVVFDDEHWITEAHKKSFHARIYHLYGRSRELLRFVVPCSDKAVARALELKVQGKIGGNQNALHPEVERELYRGLAPDSDARRLLRMAHLSAFSAIRDLYLWRREGLILDPEWEEISERLCLNKRARSGRRAA